MLLAAALAFAALPLGEPAAASPLPVVQTDVLVDGRLVPGPPLPSDERDHAIDADAVLPPDGTDNGDGHGDGDGDDHGHGDDHDGVDEIGSVEAPETPVVPAPEPEYLPEERWISVTEAPFTFGMIGFTLEQGGALPTAARFRLSADGVNWDDWRDEHFDGADAPDGGSAEDVNGRPGTQPVFIGAARWVELETSGSQEGLRAVFIDIEGRTASVLDRVKSFLSSVMAPLRSIGDGKPAGAAGPPAIVTRGQWGADESLRRAAPSYGQVRISLVHHTDGSNSYSQAQVPGILRGIYSFHVSSRGWNDIGYNFLVDKYGKIYEGRFGGMDRAVIGSQAAGFNSVSTGVSIIGSHTSVAPSAASIEAVSRVLAWKLAVHEVDPLGRTNVAGSGGGTSRFAAGQVVDLRNVSGHRDTSFTDCPGNLTYTQLSSIASRVARYYPEYVVPKVPQEPPEPPAWYATDRASGLASGEARAAVIETFGGRHVFARPKVGTGVVHTWHDPTTSRWATETLDVGGSSGHDLVALMAYGQLHVFGRPATGSGIRHLFYSQGIGWAAETLDVGGSAVDGLTATMYGDQLQLFTVAASPGPTGSIRQVFYAPGVGWLTGQLDAGTNSRSLSSIVMYGQLHLFSEANGGGLRHGWYDPGGSWNHETLDAAVSTGGSSTVTPFGNGLHTFSRTAGGAGVRHVFYLPGAGWFSETLDGAGTTGAGAAVLAGGTIRWFGEGAGDAANSTRHLFWNGSAWVAESIDRGRSSGRNAVAGVSSGDPYVTMAAVDGGVRDAWFGKSRTEFFTETLDVGAPCQPGVTCALSGSARSAVIEWDGAIHVFGAPQSGTGISHTWYLPAEGRWVNEVLDSAGSTGAHAAAFVANGQLHVMTQPIGGGGGIRQAFYTQGIGWAHLTLDAGSSHVDGLAVDLSFGQIHLFTREATNGVPSNGLRHVWYSSNAWYSETLDAPGSIGSGVVAMPAYGQLHTFAPAPGGGIRHVFYAPGAGWLTETLDAGATTGDGVTATLAPDATLHLFAAANGGGVRRHVHQPGSGWSSQTFDVGATDGVGVAASLDVVHWAGRGVGGDAAGLRVVSQFGAGLSFATIDRAVAGANAAVTKVGGALYFTYGTPGGGVRLAVYRPARRR